MIDVSNMQVETRITSWRESRWDYWARIERRRTSDDPKSPFREPSGGKPPLDDGWLVMYEKHGTTRRQAIRRAQRTRAIVANPPRSYSDVQVLRP